MYAEAVINPAMVRTIDTYFSRIYLFHQNHSGNVCTIHKKNISLVRLIIDSLISWLFLSSCTLSGTSIFSYYLLFCWGETGWSGKAGRRGVFVGQLLFLIKKLVLVRRLVVRKTASGSWSGGTTPDGGRIILIIGAMIMPALRHGWMSIRAIWKDTEKAIRNM